MADLTFSPRAYCKIILHAVKYPHCAINGLLLAKQKSKGEGKSLELHIVDSVPLFHICLNVSPMAEIALTLVDQVATSKGLVLAGYYLANENINDLSTDKPAHRIADKIAENFNGGALLVVIDNKEMKHGLRQSPFRVSQYIDGKWKTKDKANVIYEGGVTDSNMLQCMSTAQVYRYLTDFDNHLDNIAQDWQNIQFNKIIDEVVKSFK